MEYAYIVNAFSLDMVDTTKEGELTYHPFEKKQIYEFFLDEKQIGEYTIVPAITDLTLARAVADDIGVPISSVYGGPASDQFILKGGELMIVVLHSNLPEETQDLPEEARFNYLGVKFSN
jgi:hypothetical protein